MSGNEGSGDGKDAATSGAARQGGNAGSIFRRVFELAALGVAAGAALFFFKTAQETDEENAKLRDELRRAKQDSSNRCSVCLNNPCEVVVQPCGHVCLCRDCNYQLSLTTSRGCQKCPICRAAVENTANVYLS